MQPQEFISKWRAVELKERSASQSHFNDLCAVLGQENPISSDPKGEWFTFEKGASKTGGGDGWADVWKRGCFAWEYKGKHANLAAALKQLKLYQGALENPPLLIVSDMEKIEIHTSWTNMVQETHVFALGDLIDGGKRARLKKAFSPTEVEAFKPGRKRADLTADVAKEFVTLAHSLRERGHPADKVAHFVNRMVFCMFAEDVELLPVGMFKKMLQASQRDPNSFRDNARDLFRAMAKQGGKVGYDPIEWFNGGLFDDDDALPLEAADIRAALSAAEQDWSNIDPSIMGTLFERGLDPSKRSQLGAHYTDPEKILMIVNPVIIEPFNREWDSAKAEIEAELSKVKTARSEGAKTQARNRAKAIKTKFLERLKTFRILDPACGSGNFLYLGLKALKDIEHRVNMECEALGLARDFPQTGPENVLGIEINPFAAELARVSVWIGEIQWMREHGFDASRNPILKPLDTIRCHDALLNEDGTECDWPGADVIIGNPPFLGSKFMRKGRPANKKNPAILGLGDDYVNKLFQAYAGAPPASANFVSYWFQKSLRHLEGAKTQRIGLVATQSIRFGASNKPIAEAVRADQAEIFLAQQNDEWTIDGAEVRVAIFCLRKPASAVSDCILDGKVVVRIHPDLTSGSSLFEAHPLSENADLAFQGVKMNGPFDISSEEARHLLRLPTNPNGLLNSEVVRRFAENDDVTMRDSDCWALDFTNYPEEAEAALFQDPFKLVQRVKFARLERLKGAATETSRLDRYWLMQRSRTELREAISDLDRVIAVPETSEHRLFRFLDARYVFSGSLFVIARDDDTTFGCLQSRPHDVWSSGRGNRMGAGNQRRYNATRTFETYPFPDGLTPNIPAEQYSDDPRAQAIAAAAKKLNELREAWLNPSDLVMRAPEVVPGFPDRILPINDDAAAILKKRTLTNLYNERPAWLDMAHKELDRAVAAAYGWTDWGADGLPDDVILQRLFKLNQERAAAGR